MSHIERAADGWFIQEGGTAFHINLSWCDEMWRHQFKRHADPRPFHRLRYLIETGSTDQAAVQQAFHEAMGLLGQPIASQPVETRVERPELHEWIRGRRANR